MSQNEPNPAITRHPWSWIAEPARPLVFGASALLASGPFVSLAVQGAPLQHDLSPLRIVRFELSGNLDSSQKMIAAWGQAGQIVAGFNLGLDYLFIAAYAIALGLGCIVVAPVLAGRWSSWPTIGVGLSWAMLIAGLLDATENYCLYQLLMGRSVPALAIVARWAAIPKFALVALGLVYVFVGLAAVSWVWLKARRTPAG